MKKAQYVQIVALSLLILSSLSFVSNKISGSTQLATISGAGSQLVAYYSFDEGSGSTAADSAGTNNGTLTNGPTWVAGKTGTALNFDGVDDMVTASTDFLGASPAFTISAWINPRSVGAGGAGGRIVTNSSTEFQMDGNNVLLYCGSNSRSAPGSVPFNTWTHVVATRDSSGAVNLYVNGVLSGTPNQNCGTPVTGNPLRVSSVSRPFDGYIDEVRIYNRALASDEIATLASGTGSPPPSAVNGSCSTTVNMCTAGTFSDQPDTSTNSIWQCVGSNGGNDCLMFFFSFSTSFFNIYP
jgi:hypothetical protein